LAHNIKNFLRRRVLPKNLRQWSLTKWNAKFVKIGATVTQYAKYVTFQMADVAVPRQIFATTLNRSADSGSRRLCVDSANNSPSGGIKEDGTRACEGVALHRWRQVAESYA